MEANPRKKIKIERRPDQCSFFMAKKGRYCGTQRKKGEEFCVQHLPNEGNRVPCPLDPNHSVWENDLQRHLKKCNAKPKTMDERDEWYKENLNSRLVEGDVEENKETNKDQDDEDKDNGNKKDKNGDSPEETFKSFVQLVKQTVFPDLEYKIANHQGLKKRLDEKEQAKHPIQQASLMGNLKSQGLLNANSFYVEFGCGKAELSRFLNSCVQSDMLDNNSFDSENYGFGLIDRGINRMKNDPKIIKEAQEFNSEYGRSNKPTVKRTRIDIKDLDLKTFLKDCKPTQVIGISKHLCGVATDLTLKSILNARLDNFGGLLIAMCCRHVCDYDQLLPMSQQYLTTKGFDKHSFKHLKRMCSWAVSGSRLAESETDELTGLNGKEKISIGLIARRIIDESRVYAMKQLLPQHNVNIFWYVKPDVTLENVCLSITPSK
ncbi:tRNA:m(4)X modification enzyme Trm13p [[Candida] jaroonii]|uniref:tRNA:m(4)X modification enzyme Trm13p n=1 Tax=[Candida] jaroonii TaxID=467808 RepID=A0ACA9Y4A2_9ASCO|nr:tRNA:m(4)X modification enzyme Trm13p [[Candida] jaroonii]